MIYHIYGLFNEDYPRTYIGHTKDIEQRLKNHKKDAKKLNNKLYKYMREVGGEWKLEVLETHECSKKYAVEESRNWRENNRERHREQSRNWCKNNQDRVKEKNDKHKLDRFTCECGTNLRWADRRRHEESKKHLAYKNKD